MSHEYGAELAARLTLEAFESFSNTFRIITRRAQKRFEQRDWSGGRRDAEERLHAYDTALEDVSQTLVDALGNLPCEQALWTAARSLFASYVAGRYDLERAETFFNSVTRRMLKTTGVDRSVEFFTLHSGFPGRDAERSVFRTCSDPDTFLRMRSVLSGLSFSVPCENVERDARFLAREVDIRLWSLQSHSSDSAIDVVTAVFFRNKEAYVVGRIVSGSGTIPLVIPLSNGDAGIRVETVLLEEAEIANVFSFAYSHFFVDVERYDGLITFLHSILPHARPAELYTTLGYNRHGKTEFYRDLHRFVHVSKEQFVAAPGREGAVMIVFTLPNFDFVFKVIKDRPCFLRSNAETPKVITRERVRFQYAYVSHRDKAGRMVDTQEFENLRFKKKRFSPALLAEFARAGTMAIAFAGEYVILQHLYVQRKVIPLPMYFESERDPEALRRVLIDFGYFLKDIASSGVFPCDLFNTWNYGVTRWGRVVLYDYDDVLPIERVTFREKPLPRDEFEETEPEENWIFAREEDFFIDEIERYSGIPAPLRGVFDSVHSDLYTLGFWDALTARVRRGEIFDVIPYERRRDPRQSR